MSNVRNFGAAGDGKTDDTEAILHAVAQGEGVLEFPPGEYLLTRTIRVDLSKRGPFGLIGVGGAARIIMDAPGPAFHLVGSHNGTADPNDLSQSVRERERMPTVLNLQIEGRHLEADGFWLQRTMQATFEGVLLNRLRDGIRLFERNRNVIVSQCHIYNNRRIGVYLDHCNLHQIIITGSHISYCPTAGVKVEGGQVRNFQFTGNDIEYNYAGSGSFKPRKTEPAAESRGDDSADVLIDCRPEGSTIREGTITGNTIQARYSKGGANVRVIGHGQASNHKAGMLTISDNLIGSQAVGVHLDSCRGVVVSGNMIYSGHQRNLLIERSRNIVVGPNSFDHNPDYGDKELATGIRLADSQDVTLTGVQIHDALAGKHTVEDAEPQEREALLEIVRCRRVTANGLHLLDGAPYGLLVDSSSDVLLAGSTILEAREEKLAEAPIRWRGPGSGNLVASCRLGPGKPHIDDASGVTLSGNV